MSAFCPDGKHYGEGPFCTRCGQPIETAPNVDLSGKQERIDSQWYAVMPKGWGTWGDERMHGGERRMLYDILDQDEDIKALVGGTYRAEQDTQRLQRHSGVAVATDKRVIFLDKGVLGSKEVSEMPYRNIEGITHSTGMMFGGVQITGLGMAGWRIEDVRPKESAKLFADCVRSHIEIRHAAELPAATPPSAQKDNATTSVADELEKLARLVQEGFLTQEEFDLQKKRLLGL